MCAYNSYETSGSKIGSNCFNGAFRSKNGIEEKYPKCVGAASYNFMPVHNIGWSLPVNPMRKSTSHEQFTDPSQAYSKSQIKITQSETSIATDFANNLAKLSSTVRLQPPILLPLYSETYKKPAKYGYQQNIFKRKITSPLISSHGKKDELSDSNYLEVWDAKKDFVFVHEGDGGRDVLEIKDSKKESISLGSVALAQFSELHNRDVCMQVSSPISRSTQQTNVWTSLNNESVSNQ
jgi:hypothetical protein